MADPEHLMKLELGVEAWNKWRQEYPGVRPVLSEANLMRANLMRADLSDAVFRNAVLIDADLTEADLSGAYLSGADLSEAHITRARLSEADLSEADLTSATLLGAHLTGAHLTGAQLNNTILYYASFSSVTAAQADFTEARLAYTVFADTDLSEAKGLETVIHEAPSTIGIDTIFQSKGKIPEVFLRGAGVPEILITYLPSLLSQPIQYYSCFISYSHADEDKRFAHRLHDTLQGRGIRCWLDEHEILPGQKIHLEIDRGIRVSDKVLLCCSKQSLTSWWVDNEIGLAVQKEQRLWKERDEEVLALIPLNLDGYLFSPQWRSGWKGQITMRLAADFRGWEKDNSIFEEQVKRVVRALRTGDTGREPPPVPRL